MKTAQLSRLARLGVYGFDAVELTWSERANEKNTSHPEVARFAKALAGLQGARAERARQFFSWCMVAKLQPAKPADLEREIEACIEVLRERELA